MAGHYSPGIMAVVSAGELAKLYDFRPLSAEQAAAKKALAEQKQLLTEAAAEKSRRNRAEYEAENARDAARFGVSVELYDSISDWSNEPDVPFPVDQHDQWFEASAAKAARLGGISTYLAKRIISWQLTNDDLEEFEYRSANGTSTIRVDPEVYDRVVASYRAVPDLARNGSNAIREIAGTEALPRDCVSVILADAAVLVTS